MGMFNLCKYFAGCLLGQLHHLAMFIISPTFTVPYQPAAFRRMEYGISMQPREAFGISHIRVRESR